MKKGNSLLKLRNVLVVRSLGEGYVGLVACGWCLARPVCSVASKHVRLQCAHSSLCVDSTYITKVILLLGAFLRESV